MNRRKNIIWANVVIGGLILSTLGACSNDEPAATTGTPAPSNASSTDAAPIAGASVAPSTSASSAPDSKASTPAESKAASTSAASAIKPLAATKPLVAGTIAPDKPLPAEDVKAKPVAETPKPALVQGGLSESQIKTMKTMLDDAKKAVDAGKMDDAKAKFDEFAGGPWTDAAKELKTKSAPKHDDVDKAIKAVDAAGADKAKFAKALAEVSTAIDKSK
jgi:hypothetical protein